MSQKNLGPNPKFDYIHNFPNIKFLFLEEKNREI